MSDDIDRTVTNALREDLGQLDVANDITAALIDPQLEGEAELRSNEDAVLCGIEWFMRSFTLLDKHIDFVWSYQDGDSIPSGETVCRLRGRVAAILAAERTALNFLQTLSGTVTQAAKLADTIQNSDVMLLDTRKTLPGLRGAQKYAVRIGGCHNHRLGLYDAFLIKENHLMFSKSITQLVMAAKQKDLHKQVILEVENLEQLKEAVDLPVDVIMLDNFAFDDVVAAVKLVRQREKPIQLEISGSAERLDLPSLIKLGIQRISLGSLTKHCHAIDFSLRFIPPK